MISNTNSRSCLRASAGIALAAALAIVPSIAVGGKGTKAAAGLQSNPTVGLQFIENRGQWEATAKFLGKAPGIDVWVTETGLVYDLFRVRTENIPAAARSKQVPTMFRSGHVVKLGFDGGTHGTAFGWGEELTTVNYLSGDGAKGPKSASVFRETRIRGVYPGIDTRAYFQSTKPRYDLIVNPGASPSSIRMRFGGANGVQLQNATTLRITTSVGTLTVGGLFAYQQFGNIQRQVDCDFRVNQDGSVGFVVGEYDASKPLVIDPVVYSTLLGGTGSTDTATGVATDQFNAAYVCGWATSSTFPTTIGAYDETLVGFEGFVTKFLPDGSNVQYSTYLGGARTDACYAVAVDLLGHAYLTGQTDSDDIFSVGTTLGFQPMRTPAPAPPNQTPDDETDAFIAKVLPNGTGLAWGTYLGGNRSDIGFSIALGADLSIYVVGNTQSDASFPLVGAIFGTMKGDGDAFLAKVAPNGGSVTYSTYLGGTDMILPDDPGIPNPPDDPLNPFDNTHTHNDDDDGLGVRVDFDGFAYVLISTQWNDAPKVAGSFDTQVNGFDSLVLKVNQAGSALVFGTFIGGNVSEFPSAIAIDGTSNVYVTGTTNSFNYPRTLGAFDNTYNAGIDCFLTKLDRLGASLDYSTFLGTTNGARPTSIQVDDVDFAHVAGWVSQSVTNATWLPVTPNADDPTYNGPADPFLANGDAFLMVMNDTGTALQYCSYFGGGTDDKCFAIGLDGPRNAYLAGRTNSCLVENPPFPTTPGAFKGSASFPPDNPLPPPNALYDGFVIKVKTRLPYAIQSLVINPNFVTGGMNSTGTVTISGPASTTAVLVSITNDNSTIVTTPTSVTIPSGGNSAQFNIMTNPLIQVRTVVNITAIVEGDSKTAAITVTPWLEALTLSNDTVVGGNTVGGRVDLALQAPTGGIQVNLSSTVPGIASVPGSVTVPQGARTAVFDVTTAGVANSQVVDISASFSGLTKTVQLTVVPARAFALNFSPTRVSGGTPSTGTLELDGKAPNVAIVFNLVSSNPAVVTVNATVTIPAQTRSVDFQAMTSIVAVNQTVTVTATRQTDPTDVVSGNLDVLVANLISITLSPDSVVGGNPTTATVGLDLPAAAGGVTINIASTNVAVAQVPGATVTIPAGSTNTSFTVTTSRNLTALPINVDITATRGITLMATLTVNPVDFVVDVSPSQVAGGTGATGTVTLTEAAPPGGVDITLTSAPPGIVSMSGSVNIAAGDTQATFNVGTIPVLMDTLVTISGTVAAITRQDTLNVLAAVPVSLTVTPSSVPGGTQASGTVVISGPAPRGGVTVSVMSDNSAAIPVGPVIIAMGGTQQSFVINTIAVATQQVCTITATIGITSVSDTLTVTTANLIEIRFSPPRVRGGSFANMILRLDAAAPAGGAVVTITPGSTPIPIASFDPTYTIPAGATQAQFQVQTFRVSRTLAMQVKASYNGDDRFAILTVTR